MIPTPNQVFSNKNEPANNQQAAKTHAQEYTPVDSEIVPGTEFGVHSFPSVKSYNDMVESMKNIDSFVAAHEIKQVYKTWADGEKSRGMFLGFCEVPSRSGDKKIGAVRWMTAEGKVFVHAAEILVGDCRSFNLGEGTPIEITYLGFKETKSKNKAMNFSVLILRQSK